MTVATEVAYAERDYTGVETDFAPGMVAQSVSHIGVSYRDANGVVTALTRGVHVAVTKVGDEGFTGAVSATPLNMPPAPGTVIFERTTPAVQETDFDNLEDFDPNIHTRLFDADALRAGEVRSRQARAIAPWASVTDEAVDFRPRRIIAPDPVNDQDVATKIWVLSITGILNLTALVAAAAASAAAALGYQTGAQAAQTLSEAARDASQGYANNSSASAAQALASANLATALYNQIDTRARDWGDFQGATTIALDFGDFH